MHAIDLAELAGTFVRGAAAQVGLRLPLAGNAPRDYWLTARFRHENWMHDLSQHRDSIGRPGTSRRARQWDEVLPIIQEILLAEPLARVVAYFAAVIDELGIDREFSPLANGVLAAHIEARNRCLHLIVFGQSLPVEQAVILNRLRRALESFNDQLLSCLPPIDNCGLYCFDKQQMLRQRTATAALVHHPIWPALHTMCLWESLWQALRNRLDWRTGSARLNYQLSQHILRLSPAASFDSFGIPHTAAWGKLLRPSPEAQFTESHSHPMLPQLTTSQLLSERQADTVNLRRRD